MTSVSVKGVFKGFYLYIGYVSNLGHVTLLINIKLQFQIHKKASHEILLGHLVSEKKS